MEDMIDEWRRFNLRDEEKEHIIELNPEEIKNLDNQMEFCLVGKLLSNRIISAQAMKNALIGVWKTRNKFKAEVVGKNYFLFKFENQSDKGVDLE